MKISLSRLFPLLLVLALALLSLWLERAVHEDPKHPALSRHDPDYVVDGFSVVTYDEKGGVESRLSARRMMHYPDNDATELITPVVQKSAAGRPTLSLEARRGTMTRDGAEIMLYDSVQLTRDAGAAGGQARLRTSYLHYARAKSLVSTDREVLITAPGRTLSGRGMEYDGEQHRFLLRSQVRARLEFGKRNSS